MSYVKLFSWKHFAYSILKYGYIEYFDLVVFKTPCVERSSIVCRYPNNISQQGQL